MIDHNIITLISIHVELATCHLNLISSFHISITKSNPKTSYNRNPWY